MATDFNTHIICFLCTKTKQWEHSEKKTLEALYESRALKITCQIGKHYRQSQSRIFGMR